MKYLLDSNIVIAAILAEGDELRGRMAECDEDDLAVSAVVYADIAHGSMHGKPRSLSVLDRFLRDIPILPFDEAAGRTYATLSFVRAGYDRLIGAHALSLGLTLVTNNVSDFKDIPGLTVENWTL